MPPESVPAIRTFPRRLRVHLMAFKRGGAGKGTWSRVAAVLGGMYLSSRRLRHPSVFLVNLGLCRNLRTACTLQLATMRRYVMYKSFETFI